MTTTTSSIQIPDLPSLTRSFELHTNQACHSTTLSSEAWFLGTPVLSDQQERNILPSAKFGLLSGLCFPTCDPTQLRLLTDFVTVLGLAHERVLRAKTVDAVGWSQSGSCTADNDDDDDDDDRDQQCKRGIEVLNDHELFKHLTHSISKLTSRASQTWHTQFSTSVLAYKRAQLDPLFWEPSFSENSQTSTTATDPPGDTLDRFISLRRHTNGAHMVFDLVEFALGHRPLEAIYEDMDEEDSDDRQTTRRAVLIHTLEALRNLAADIVSLSSDVVAYNKFQSTHHSRRTTTLPHNAVAVCMLFKHVSVQGATNMVVKLVRDKIREFLEIEQALRNLIDESKRASGLGSWIKSSLSSLIAGNSQVVDNPVIDSLSMLPRNDRSARLIGQLIAYTQVLRDYIAGNIHWFYETELYFGTKGEHVREFRWIFLAEPDL
ncbi:hypothetical protein M378DRAFT_187717 [Amanita muscaria Koide BX008]|uniref:Uncharacterized protein n=1 Tax=Amanita muscaria (strain Koide BX008) TaxID=946122 RepID=A0A0C2SCU5_AMAMK|nr:hypothetical protein M378DRAFT_187717 [Amanita muscaria Koide BX008]